MLKTFIGRYLLLLLLSLIGVFKVGAQTYSISGPTCVEPGVTYQYSVSKFSVNLAFPRTWCITNGVIVGSGGACYSDVNTVNVIWNSGVTSGTLSFENGWSGQVYKYVTITAPVSPGSVSSTYQFIDYNTVPSTIYCEPASNGGCSVSYAYQWQLSSDNVNWSDISGATAQDLYFSDPLTQTRYYRRKVTVNPSGTVAYSNTSTVEVSLPPLLVPGTISSNQTIVYSATPATLTGNSARFGACGGNYTYQWESSTDGNNWSAISGATALNYSPGPLYGTTYFRRKVTCGTQSAYSNTLTITIIEPLNAGYISASQTINYGTTPAPLEGNNSAYGGNCGGNYTYQWESSTDGNNWTPIGAASSGPTSIVPNALTQSAYYRRKVTCNEMSAISNTVLITVNPQLLAGAIGSAQNINYGTTPAILTGSAASGGGCGTNYAYQWQSSPDGSSWTSISGATASSYSPGALTQTTQYRRMVSCNGESAYSNPVTITVYPQLFPGSISSPQTIKYGATAATLSGSTPSGGGCGAAYTYQWESSADGSNWSALGGASGASFAPGTLYQTTHYRRKVSCNGAAVYSNAVQITVHPQLLPGALSPAVQTIAYNTRPGALSATNATGGACSGNYTYQWQYSTDNTNFTDIELETGVSLSFYHDFTETTYIRRKTVCDTDSVYTAVATIQVTPPFTGGTITTTNQVVAPNTVPTSLVAVEAQNCTASLSYQWQESTDGYAFSNINGATGRDLSFSGTLSQAMYYRRKALCGTAYAFTNVVQVSIQEVAPITQPIPNELDTLLIQEGINIDSLFAIESDSVAFGRRPQSSEWTLLDSLAAQINPTLERSITPVDESELIRAAAIAPLENLAQRLIDHSEGGAGSDSAQAVPLYVDDALLASYINTGKLDQLEALVLKETTIGFETANQQLEKMAKLCTTCQPLTPVSTGRMRRSVVLEGPAVVARFNTVRYYAQFGFSIGSPSSIYWTVSGGSIVAQNTNPANGPIYADISWTSFFGVPYVAVFDRASMQYGSLNVTISQLACRIAPSLQTLYYGQQPNAISVLACAPSGGATTVHQWQVLDVYNNSTWTDVPGATGEGYQPPTLTRAWLLYRRITRLYNTSGALIDTRYTSAVSVKLQALDAGTLSSGSTTIPYNTSPAINASAPSGGFVGAAGSSLTYSWEVSVSGGPWQVIGNGQAFSSYMMLYSNTKFRRQVQVSGISIAGLPEALWKATTAELQFNTFYQTVDFENRNYVRENVVQTRGVATWEAADALSNEHKTQTTTYLDGLSRSVQTVGKGTHYDAQNGQWWDMVQPITYGAGGRIDKTLLPYPSTETPGKYKNNASSDQPAYYAAKFGDSHAFAKVEYDGSPLNTVKKAFAPGDGWVGNDVNVTGDVEPYSITEGVRIWTVGYNSTDLPQSSGFYPSRFLFKQYGSDEKGKKVITYTDRAGQVVLKKVQLENEGPDLSIQHNGWLCTYYVYDDFGQLRYTITPKAVKELAATGWVMTTQIADQLCFRNEYDALGRLVAKKSPDKGLEKFVYDQRNRLVFSQKASMDGKFDKDWLVSLYDELNREVFKGIFHSGETGFQSQIQVMADNATAATTTVTTSNGGSFEVWGFPQGMQMVAGVVTELGFTYYDQYDYTGVKSFTPVTLAYQNGDVDPSVVTQRLRGMPTGSKVKVLKDGVDQYLVSTPFYDEEGRAIQTAEDNLSGGVDVTATQYHFDGRTLGSLEVHQNPGTPYSNFPILTKYRFDKVGRVSAIAKKINNTGRTFTSSASITGAQEDSDAGYKTIANYGYNELGRSVKKVLSPEYNNGQGLETIEYDYNIRGWLTGINKAYALGEYSANQWDHYFGLYIGYDNLDGKFAASRHNGQITGVQWKSQGDNTPRRYDFTYDNANRLTGASFTQKGTSGEAWNRTRVDFSVNNLTYDENGNILSQTQMGILPGGTAPVAIDQLVYLYKIQSNRLLRVTDQSVLGVANGKQGDFKDGTNSGDDYDYDIEGRTIKDWNRGISQIRYNYMDKPELITVVSKGGAGTPSNTLAYVYDASGAKLQKIVTNNDALATGGQTRITTTTYIGSFIYESVTVGTSVGATELQSISHEEGRIRVITPYNNPNDPSNFIGGGMELLGGKQGVFDYFIQDHLGNVRATLTEEVNKAASVLTMEDANAAVKNLEEGLFGNPGANNEVANTRDQRPEDWTSATHPPLTLADNQKVSKLLSPDGSTKVGPNVLLKVMAGDKISARVDYYYARDPGADGSNTGLQAMVQSLLGAFSGGKALPLFQEQGTAIEQGLSLNDPLKDLFAGQSTSGDNPNAPKAYLNYLFFDEQFNYVGQGSGFQRVETADNGAEPLTVSGLKAPKNGYVYVYLSNASAVPVYFDNFAVSHEHSALIQEDHYYPFGLRIAGISSQALASTLNPQSMSYGYQGSFSEEVNDLELNYNEFFLRHYDPQVGRWTTPDPYDEFPSPYVGMGNDPINTTDPDGGSIWNATTGSALADASIRTVAGSILGGVIGGILGDWERESIQTGMAVGGSIVMIAGVDWGQVGDVLGEVGDWIGNNVGGLFGGQGWQDVSIILAQSAFNGARSGDDWVRNSNPQGIKIDDLSKESNTELISDLNSTIKTYTSGVLQDVGKKMVDNFAANTGNDFTNEVLNNHITASSQFQDKFSSVRKLIQSEVLRVNGDFSKYVIQKFSLPSFPKWEAGDPFSPNSLYTLIGGTQYGEITLNKYKYNARTKSFSGRITVKIMDDFGVSASDVKKAANIPFSKGIRAMWYLQHVKGYKPFSNIYKRQFDIKF